MATAPSAPLRDISTRREPQRIAIDGVLYELTDVSELSTLERVRLRRLGLRVTHIVALADPTDEQAAECDTAIAALFAAVAPSVPQDVAARLTVDQMAAVIESFIGRRTPATGEQALQAGTETGSAQTSLPLFGDCSATTAAT